MKNKLIVAVILVGISISGLIYSVVVNTAKAVMTVDQLVENGIVQNNIRLGARVADGNIDYQMKPNFKLNFSVRDIAQTSKNIPVEYQGIKPDTLQVGRDVILEGDYDGAKFHARSLSTQCPSKYEPPAPPGMTSNSLNTEGSQGIK